MVEMKMTRRYKRKTFKPSNMYQEAALRVVYIRTGGCGASANNDRACTPTERRALPNVNSFYVWLARIECGQCEALVSFGIGFPLVLLLADRRRVEAMGEKRVMIT
jgi:hypothetical protein